MLTSPAESRPSEEYSNGSSCADCSSPPYCGAVRPSPPGAQYHDLSGEKEPPIPDSTSERNYWNNRYGPSEYLFGTEPADFLLQVVERLPKGGTVLDLAAGEGRNAVFMAKRGFDVTAWDLSATGLAKAAELARREGVTLRTAELDLETARLPVETVDVLLCFYYTQRSLFEQMERALRPGGCLLMENVTTEQPSHERSPRDPSFRLAPNELLRAFPGLRVLLYREDVVPRGVPAGKHVASLLAMKPSR